MLALGDLGLRLQALKTMLSSGERGAPDGLGDAVVECCEALAEANRVSEALDLLATLGGLKSTFSVDVVRRLDATLALVLDQAWRSEEALAVVRPLIASCQSDPAVPRTFICALRICEGSSLWKMNRVDEAIALLRDLRSELLQLPDSRHLALVAQQLCSAYMLKGDSSTAIAFAWDAIVSARRVGARFVEACALGNLGMLEKQRCRWAASIEAHSDARRIFEQGRNAYRATKEKRSLAIVHWKMGHLSDASRLAAECISESEELRDETMHWYGTLLAGLTLLHSGAYAEAAAILTSDANWETPRSNSRPSLLTSEFLGDVELEQGNAEAALQHYDEVFPKAVALVPKGDIVAELRRRRAECFLLLGRADEAYGEAMTGLSHCRELGDRYEEAATYRVAALAAAAIGRPREAKQLFEQGFSFYEDIETPYEWGKLWMSYGDWLRGPHAGEYADPRGALESYIVAREHFERMGAEAKFAEANARFTELSVALSAGAPPASAPPPVGAASLTDRSSKSPVRRPQRRPRNAELERTAEWAAENFGLITRHGPFLQILLQVQKVSRSGAPVLILGESGTGKELVARGVHRLSGRQGAYLAINCGALPRETMESELFGHIAGAFTGASRDKPGLFEVCDKGTTFLDEIGEMSLDLQSKLLRFLETGESRRMGATRNSHADVRIVAATNRERAALERGDGFRVDLYYRLAHAVFELPPLRQRGDDVEVLVEHFLAESCRREGKSVRFSDEAMERLLRFNWPGNIRQLRAVVNHAVLLADDGEEVAPHLLQIEVRDTPGSFSEEMDLIEKRRMEDALRQHGGSKTLAARALRMKRTTFYAKMKRYGMEQ